MLTYIDHVTLAVHDLDAAITTFRERFLFVAEKKRTDGDAQVTRTSIPLLQGYLELLSLANGATPAGSSCRLQLGTFLETQEGLFKFAIGSTNIKEDVARLRDRGSRLGEPIRLVPTDGESHRNAWVSRPPPETGTVEPYLVQHDHSREESTRQDALSQPFAIRSIEEATIIVANVEAALRTYERDFGLKPSRQLAGRAQLALMGSKIMLVPSSVAPSGTPLGLHSVSLGTTDINGARSQLRNREVKFDDDPYAWGVTSQIDPGETFGARIDLVQM